VKNKITSGFISTLGYILSPLSWWNDLFVNIPLAYGFAFLFGLISKNLFYPMMIIGYWITNILGLILMHVGIKGFLNKEDSNYSKKELLKDFIFSILYTLIIVFLIKIGWLKFPTEYFK
jgi:uncharacterized membrane protein